MNQKGFQKKPRQTKNTQNTKAQLIVSPTKCIFCKKMNSVERASFGPLLLKALYTKYSSSQNYYYCRDINDLLDDRSTPAVAIYRDLEHLIEEEEYLKRWYQLKENNGKMAQLTEYYKYHRDIPRLFMAGICITIHKFHDKRRRLEYARIKNQLGIQNDDRIQSESTHPHYRKDNNNSRDCSVRQLQYMLKGMDLSIRKTEQQSCTMILRDVLNSIIKKNGFDESFDKSQAFGIVQLPDNILKKLDRTCQAQPPKKNPSIPQINIDAINKQYSSIQSSPVTSPTVALQKLQLKLPVQITKPNSLKLNLKGSGAQTTRESTQNALHQKQQQQQGLGNTKALLTARSTQSEYISMCKSSLQKLVVPIVQKQLQQQLLELQNRAKALQQMKPSVISPPKFKSPQATPHRKTPSLQQYNNHFVQPVFNQPSGSKGSHTYQKSTMLPQVYSHQIAKNSSQRAQQDNQVSSQPTSPCRPPSVKLNQDISIKFNQSKMGGSKVRVPSVYTINQNNIVNIYLDEKMKNGLLSSRGSSPSKQRKILDCENPFKQQLQQVQVNFKKHLS